MRLSGVCRKGSASRKIQLIEGVLSLCPNFHSCSGLQEKTIGIKIAKIKTALPSFVNHHTKEAELLLFYENSVCDRTMAV